MHGLPWAAKHHNKGFVVREHVVQTDFVIPSRPMPRDKFFVEVTRVENAACEWPSARIEVFARNQGGEPTRLCSYERNHAPFQTFEPFRQGARELALVSRDYTKTAVLDLATGQIIAEETEGVPGNGFCPVGFYVPDWWDANDDSIIPGSEYFSADHEWPNGDFGFVWGCIWGDDATWKLQHLDLRRVQEGVITRTERFGHVELATGDYETPCFTRDVAPQETNRGKRTSPPFISLARHNGATRVTVETFASFDLDTGARRHAEEDAQASGDFPAFMKNPENRIATASQFTKDIDGYVFDGADGSQVAFWKSTADRISTDHTHDFDEWVHVIEGTATVIMGETRIELRAGDEYTIPKGTLQRMAITAGTRTVHVFGGKRAERAIKRSP